MNINDDDVRALENRLRLQGWNVKRPVVEGEEDSPPRRYRRHLKTSPVDPDAGFGILDRKAREAGQWLAENRDEAEYPIRQWLAAKFGLTYDEAVRAVAEAERLSGETL